MAAGRVTFRAALKDEQAQWMPHKYTQGGDGGGGRLRHGRATLPSGSRLRPPHRRGGRGEVRGHVKRSRRCCPPRGSNIPPRPTRGAIKGAGQQILPAPLRTRLDRSLPGRQHSQDPIERVRERVGKSCERKGHAADNLTTTHKTHFPPRSVPISSSAPSRPQMDSAH